MSGWICELKFDGYRMVAGVDEGRVQVANRNGADATKGFPEVVQGLGRLAGGPHILDGEICVLDSARRSDFERLQQRARRRYIYPDFDAVTFLRAMGSSPCHDHRSVRSTCALISRLFER